MSEIAGRGAPVTITWDQLMNDPPAWMLHAVDKIMSCIARRERKRWRRYQRQKRKGG